MNNLLSQINTMQIEDIIDIRRALNLSVEYLEKCVKNVKILNDEIYDIFRVNELYRNKMNFVKIGVYEIKKKNSTPKIIYHIVSDLMYEFKEVVNQCWELVNEFDLQVNKALNINSFIIDINYWLSIHAY